MRYIYLITDLKKNKTYIGKRTCPSNKTPETDDYYGSGTIVTAIIRGRQKHNEDLQRKRIIGKLVAEQRRKIQQTETIYSWENATVMPSKKVGFSF